ncbi:MAG: 2-oxoisovalerate dehydrogenase [Acidobacteria bacterium]|nr:2-oxoisovalerate dehydrogenase [Acidobacteriota bacterium]
MASSEIIFEVEESAEGGFEARALGASIFTQAETMNELRSAVRDAVLCHFDEGQAPAVVRLHLVHDEVFAV